MNYRIKKTAGQIFLHVIILVLIFVMLYPLAMALWSAFKNENTFQYTKWYPTLPLFLDNIAVAVTSLSRYMFNTAFVALTGTAGMLAVSSLAAYSFSKLNFPGKNVIFVLVIALMMIPSVLTLVPAFMLYKQLVGLDNYAIQILPQIVGPVFAVFLLRSFFEGLPDSVFEASRIDGASELSIYTRICLPLSKPIIGTLTIMQISGSWSDYQWPLLTLKSEEYFPISLGLMLRYVGQTTTDYPHITAGFLVASTPLILLFVFANKFYVQGLTGSGMRL
ncbi:MAG: carbohydrate ABC transporter permease [Prolixibacteraceae bacterium]|nr:carbohydrate ABC transporter permease [Prolixibacteraceae bacterium]